MSCSEQEKTKKTPPCLPIFPGSAALLHCRLLQHGFSTCCASEQENLFQCGLFHRLQAHQERSSLACLLRRLQFLQEYPPAPASMGAPGATSFADGSVLWRPLEPAVCVVQGSPLALPHRGHPAAAPLPTTANTEPRMANTVPTGNTYSALLLAGAASEHGSKLTRMEKPPRWSS